MRWTNPGSSAGVPPVRTGGQPPSAVQPSETRLSGRSRNGFALLLSANAVILLYAFLLPAAPPEKRLSVYSIAANYSLPLIQRDARDYVGLLELLEPLGAVNAKAEAQRWRIRYNNVEADFIIGKNRARIQGRDADLFGRFLLENGRGLVPLAALSTILPHILGGPVTLHEDSSRLFIGSVAVHFTASLTADNPPRLVFNFTAPVNPSVATEPGSLRMTFSREPLVAPASPTLTFGSKTIPSATYSEGNGAAVIKVTSAIPVIAGFSSNGRTITVSPIGSARSAATPASPPAQTAASPFPANPQANATPANAPAQTSNATPASPTPVSRRYFAVVDASHGGDDHGETLSGTLLEKDLTLALARSLRQELESRGIPTLVLRDSDANLTLDQRAAVVNSSNAAVYVALHAASSGHGVRIYTTLLPYGGDDRGPFRSWTTSQHSSLPLSRSTATAITVELQRRQIPVRTLSAALRPLNNVIPPALAVEVASQGSDVMQLTAPDYQQLITSAVATAIAGVRDKLGAAP